MGFASISKNFERLAAPEMTVDVMRRAFGLLRAGRPGPVVVEIPTDVGAEDAGGISAYRPVKRAMSAGDPRDIEAAAGALIAAKRAVIYAGQGVLYVDASDRLRELAELLEIPVATSVGGKSAFPEDHPLALGATGRTMGDAAVEFVKAAALVLLERVRGGRAGRTTLGADKAYDTRDFVADLREAGLTAHVAQHTTNRRSAIDRRATRSPGYAMSITARRRIERIFG